jgi:hypothetical protein
MLLTVSCVASSAQEPKSGDDEALDRLIEKIADPASTKSKSESSQNSKNSKDPAKRDKKSESSKTETQASKTTSEGRSEEKSGNPGDVAPKDQDLDSLLEKLGESKDEPEATEPKKPQAGAGEPQDQGEKGKGGSSESDQEQLGKKDRDLDERLEELTGRRRKKHRDEDDAGSGPVSDIVKQMREIEERLGKPDTGEETQRKQKQIVKRLDTLIEQARQAGSSSKQMRIRQVRQAGQKPGGSQQGQQAGANARGAPLAKPAKPNNPRSMAGGKDIWGHLPPELRQEMENSFKEEALPDKIDLIKRYYLSVSKSRPTRED